LQTLRGWGAAVKPAFLVGFNFVREQRWPILVLLLWILLLAFLGLISDVPRGREDLLFIFKQVALYVVVFSIFFGGSAIYNERKTRRILAVLSKAVGRQQYLSGLVLGVTMCCAIYCFSLGITGSWTLGEAGFPPVQVWFLMLCVIVACMLAGTLALMFSTFLNPFFAAGATAAVLAAPVLLSQAGLGKWADIMPVYTLTVTVMDSSFRFPGSRMWSPILLAVGETIIFWVLAARIFARVDIAVAVE
jgi:ABC-type transport system involved in multi-copper enzyme maturation permease subunit